MSSRSSALDRVDDGVLRRELEHHGDVAELQVRVDEHHRLLGALREQHAEVRGDDRLAGTALGREHGDHATELTVALFVAGHRRRRGRHDQARRGALHGFGQLTRLDGGLEHVLDTGSQRLAHQVGGQAVGDHDRPDLTSCAEQLLGRRELRARCERRTQHHDHGLAGEPRRQLVDRRERCRSLSELHGQARSRRLVRVDDRDRDLGNAATTDGARARAGHRLARVTAERAGHFCSPPGPYGRQLGRILTRAAASRWRRAGEAREASSPRPRARGTCHPPVWAVAIHCTAAGGTLKVITPVLPVFVVVPSVVVLTCSPADNSGWSPIARTWTSW